MSTHPYIPLFVDDYDAATTHLTPEEDGVYGRLLRLCWRTPGCSLPDEPVWIARKIRLSTEDFARVAQPILDEFFTRLRGRLIQRRLKREYDDISRKKSARVAAGKKGGTAKAAKTKGNTASNATALPPDARAFPDPYPDPERRELTLSSERPPSMREAEFEAWWSNYPRKTGKLAARKAYDTAVKRGAVASILQAALVSTVWANDPRFIPHPATWLNEGRWLDEASAQTEPAPRRVGFV